MGGSEQLSAPKSNSSCARIRWSEMPVWCGFEACRSRLGCGTTIVVPVPGERNLNPSELINGCEAIKKIHDWKRSGVSHSYHSKTLGDLIESE